MLKRLTIAAIVLVSLFVLLQIKSDFFPIQNAQPPSGLYGGIFDNVSGGLLIDKETAIVFPQDHLSHDQYAVEWWYLTANLFDENGNQYPLQWTLFRFSNFAQPARWGNEHQFMGHGKISDIDHTWFSERFARGGVGNAGVELNNDGNFSAYIDDWNWTAHSTDLFPATLQFSTENKVSAKLHLTSDKNYVLQGENGYSAKFSDDSHASLYYSQPFIHITGTLTLPDRSVDVLGQAWFDHEWSARLSDANTLGWDWFSLHLESGQKLMLYNVRHRELKDSWFGSLVDAQGQKIHLKNQDIVAKPLSYTSFGQRKLPLHWRLRVPTQNIDLAISMFKQDQWNNGKFSYYEGAVHIEGSHKGVGFIELTGY